MSSEAKLGNSPKGTEGRDAVHVAIMPVQIGEDQIAIGASVKLKDGKAVLSNRAEAVGILDPFSIQEPRLNEWVWLCLFPGTIKGLRHVWEHPAFSSEVMPPSKPDTESELWLKRYVRNHCPYWEGEPDQGYSAFIGYVKNERWIYYYGSDCHDLSDVEDAEELFRHLSIVLGREIDASYFEVFTCSC